jgi:hypothetical protein
MSGEEKKSARFEFPSIVYDMLEDVADDPIRSLIVSWMPHGRSFRVHDGSRFETEVMPDYFRERYASFRFLLEQWGFVGLRKGKDRGAYYNAKFVRGQRHLIANVSKEDMLAAVPEYSSPRDEPDFHSMPPAVWTKELKIGVDDQHARVESKTVKSKANPTKTATKSGKTINSRSAVSGHRKGQKSDDDGSSSRDDDSSNSSGNLSSNQRTRSKKQSTKTPASNLPRKRFKPLVTSTSNDGLSISEEESDSKLSGESSRGSRTILFAPTLAVFSGFNLPSKNMKLIIVKSSKDLGGEKPFILKRPIRP